MTHVPTSRKRALTLWQPWAHIVSLGEKLVENRPWSPPDWLIGKRFAIHAGKRWDDEGAKKIEQVLDRRLTREDVAFGAILATAELYTVVSTGHAARLTAGDGQEVWFSGPYGWILRDVRMLKHPIPCRGFQGLWSYDKLISGSDVQRLVGDQR